MKILFSLLFVISSLFSFEAKLKEYFTEIMKYNKYVELISVDIVGSKEVAGLGDYKAYFVKFKLKDKNTGEIFEAPEKVFSNGKFLSTGFIDMATKQDLKMSTYPDLPKSIYNDAHLISGKATAKNKIVVFSDPRCPSCKRTIPELITYAEKNVDKIALYYYHYPLKMHPKAKFISKLIIADIIKNNNLSAVKKAYLADFDLSPNLDDELLKAYNAQVGTNLVMKDIEGLDKKLQADMDLANNLSISGTPAIFVNGEFTRDYASLIK
ncbi:MAG: Unknown protein [uncultured Campylobacterales bacterium]|uniref:Thioredoxin-like fold domain-containing protein n=1 Tax=uncultured Campylobacterales bacterium TaxID=352960 RepID=A0A6S6SMP9_9BACT|nr:MAG: Unknown protein [uncultured Campylobacterales bacterium]